MKQLFLSFILLPLLLFSSEKERFSAISFGPEKKIGYIALTDRKEAISEATWIYINQALSFYKKEKPACILIEINSPGGEVFAAGEIADALKEMDTQYGIPVICYINNWAISAGAMLAYSCRYIIVSKDASMGAAEPVIMGGQGAPQSASEKINSALRTDFGNRAEYFGRNPFIAEAMVDKDIILVERDKNIIKLDSEDQIITTGANPDRIISKAGKLLTLNSSQMIAFNVADYLVKPTKYDLISKTEQSAGIWPVSKTALSQIEHFDGAIVHAYQMSWQTTFLAFLASPAISSLLLMVVLISIYLELSSPGIGIPGAVGLISLFFVLLSSFALEAIHWLEPILLIFGLLLIALEVSLLPTGGLFAVIGAILVVGALVAMMIPGIEKITYDGESLNAAGEYVLARLTWLSGAFLLSLVVIWILSRYVFPGMASRMSFLKRIVLSDETQSKEALFGSEKELLLSDVPEKGARGQVVATLRPAGKIAIGDKVYDAVSTGGYIMEGQEVVVIEVQGHKVIVDDAL